MSPDSLSPQELAGAVALIKALLAVVSVVLAALVTVVMALGKQLLSKLEEQAADNRKAIRDVVQDVRVLARENAANTATLQTHEARISRNEVEIGHLRKATS